MVHNGMMCLPDIARLVWQVFSEPYLFIDVLSRGVISISTESWYSTSQYVIDSERVGMKLSHPK